ncbi:MAG: CpsD/CapB family tyrosine-protein kinase [Eubacteriales bacterium]|nr:CpsD/CapB family tyrosine-protein kinase [Eubacteriales bacterium]
MRINSENNYICENLSFASKEAYKKLRANTLFVLSKSGKDNGAIIGITSSTPFEGKSLTSVNLAYSLAELGGKVLLIDSDMRRSSIHEKLMMDASPGLSELIRVSNSVHDAIRTYQSSSNDISFDVIPGGEPSDNPSEMLSSECMDKLLKVLRSAYDYIILDLPPVGAVIDAVSVGKNIDGMIFVVRENYCPAAAFEESVKQLRFLGIKIIGLVVNGSLKRTAKKYSYY